MDSRGLFCHSLAQNSVHNPADRAVRERNPINILNARLNIAGGHALGYMRQDVPLNVPADPDLLFFFNT